MYLISVYFDEKATQTLQRYIDKIAAETKNTFMTEHRVPPHMTIAALEARNAEVLIEPFLRFSERVTSGKISIVSIGQLLPYVFYVTPVLNAYLQELSIQTYKAFHGLHEVTQSKYYQPSSWLPHVTLAKTLTGEQMRQAFGVMQEQFSVFDAQVTAIGLAKVNPHEDISYRKLI